MKCPICERPVVAGTPRCPSCGADLFDDEVRSLGGSPVTEASLGEAGTLAQGRFVGLDRAGLESGDALRRTAVVGAVILAISFVLPVVSERGTKMTWDLLERGPRLALLFPLVAAVLGAAIALVPGLSGRVRAAALAILGGAGFILSVGPLGRYGETPRQLATLANLGLVVAGVSAAARVLAPLSRLARIGMIAGGALFLVGLFLPFGDTSLRVGLETEDFADRSSAGAALLAAWNANYPLSSFFLFFTMLPLGLIALAAGVGWKRPEGLWDKASPVLRTCAWLLFFWPAISYAIGTFAMMGWHSRLAESLLMGRSHLFVLAVAFVLWLNSGLLGIADWIIRRVEEKP